MKLRILLLAATGLVPVSALAQTGTEHIVVYGTAPGSDMGLDAARVPTTVQDLDAAQLEAQHGDSLLDALGAQVAGVSLNDTQGNGMALDVHYHGFEASPLQGTPQGLAVYQDGVRLNEAFGDTVNWDAIPEIAIADMQLWSANPVFGLNALGGAINLTMKTGHGWQGTEASVQGGSFGHVLGNAQFGMEDGNFSFYGAAEGVQDDGWRLHSASNAVRFYGDAGWRLGDSEIHLVASGAQSGLGVVGPTPIALAEADSAAVYTWPQTTQNRVGSLALNGKTSLADHWQLQVNAYVRSLRQRHVDGNDADFEECSAKSSYGGDLCLEDDGFPAPSPKTIAFRDQFVILTQGGASIPFTDDVTYGTLDRTFTDATSGGFTAQVTSDDRLFGMANYFTLGGSLDAGAIGFRSTSTLGQMQPSLAVTPAPGLPGSGSVIHAAGDLGYAPADLGAVTHYYGLYAVDALNLTDAVTVTAGFRLNAAEIDTRDRSGAAPELNGSHGFTHLNPIVGATWQTLPGVSLFAGYSEANRAPTPLELDCATATKPCLLEGSLVADPPLKQVVAHTVEAGLRGEMPGTDGSLTWSASAFHTDSDNDIVSLASVIQGRGYFTNVPETTRQGADVMARYQARTWSTYVSWSYLDATYQFTGDLASPNNPNADDDGNVTVTPGRHIPLSPAQQLRAGGDTQVLPGFHLGAEFAFTGSQYYDGDPSNLNARLPSYWVVNLRSSYQLDDRWQLYGIVDNLFDRHDATYGTYFDPDDTAGLLATPLSDSRSVTLRQPISFQLGLKLQF